MAATQQTTHSYPIVIRFIRRQLEQAYDDTIKIICENLGTPRPRLYKYEFATLDLSRVQNYYFVSEDELLQTIHNAFIMARVDRDPYVSIQVDIPGFPSVMLHREDLAQMEVLEIVMYNIQTCLRSWPSVGPIVNPFVSASRLMQRPLMGVIMMRQQQQQDQELESDNDEY